MRLCRGRSEATGRSEVARFNIHLTTTNKFFLGCTPTSGASTARPATADGCGLQTSAV